MINYTLFEVAKLRQIGLITIMIFVLTLADLSGQVKLQWEIDELEATQFKSKAVFSLIDIEKQNQVQFAFYRTTIDYVKLRQGRLKNDLPFSFKDNKLVVVTGDIDFWSKSEIEIAYVFDLEDSLKKQNSALAENYLILNPQNITGSETGLLGLWFPVLQGRRDMITQLNLKYSVGMNLLLPGEATFEVVDKKHRAQLWQMNEAVTSQNFYLAIGKFTSKNTKALQKELKLQKLSKEQLLLAATKTRLKPLMDFLRTNGDVLSDKEIMQLANSKTRKQHPIIKSNYEGISIPDENYFLQYQAVLGHFDDSTQGQVVFWDYLVHQFELDEEALLSSLMEDLAVTQLESFLLLRRYEQSIKVLPDSIKLVAKTLSEFVGQELVLPQIDIRFSFKKSTEELWILYHLSDSALVPFSYKIYLNDSVVTESEIFNYGTDTVKIALMESPFNIDLGFYNAPVVANIQKPDTYWLYTLQNASTSVEKKHALKKLLQTKNLNLLATVMGLALDEEDPDLKLMALDNFKRLNAFGQQKLELVLKDLSKNAAHRKVSLKAAALLNEMQQ